MIANKEMLLNSADRAVKAVGELDAGIATDEEAFFIIGTAIHWLMDCEARLEEDHVKMRHEDNEKFSGLKFANNCLKHNKTFEKVHISAEGHMYSLQFPAKYDDVFYVWSSLDDVKVKGFESQRKRYKEKLEGLKIYSSLYEIFKLIQRYYQAL